LLLHTAASKTERFFSG